MRKYLLPRGYLSYTQLMLWEKRREQYIKTYLEGEEFGINTRMELGSLTASELEKDKAIENPFIEQFRILTPPYKYREKELVAEKDGLKLLGKPDGCDLPPKKARLGEYKTGVKWTQKMADKSDQITFYNLLLYLKYGKLFERNFVHWAETKVEDGDVVMTGKVQTFETKRKLIDVMRLYTRCTKTATEITNYIKENVK